MENKHPFGNPFTVLNFFEDFENSIANEQLIKMFEHPDVKTMNIVALSIVGPYRKGKSLFLNYCLRYLYGHVSDFIIYCISFGGGESRTCQVAVGWFSLLISSTRFIKSNLIYFFKNSFLVSIIKFSKQFKFKFKRLDGNGR